MIRSTILPLALLFAATTVLAQNKRAPDCPLGIEASHAEGLPQGTNAATAAPALVQNIHLRMTNPLQREIVAAQFRVRGFSAMPRTRNLSDSYPDLVKTVHIVLDVKPRGEVSRDLSLNRFAAVTSIDLISVTYADRGTWHSPFPAACTVAPGMLMLVASAQ